MVDLNDQRLRRQNALDDITETTGLVFLGLTIGCARCHDHKFDPIPQTDYYGLQAFFAGARFRDDYPLAGANAKARVFDRSVLLGARAQRGPVCLDPARGSPSREKLAPGDPPGLNDEAAAAFSKPAAERSPT